MKSNLINMEAASMEAAGLKGVKVSRDKGGRIRFMACATLNGETKYLGSYNSAKEAAKAYDLFVIRQNLNRGTNFIKKK